MNRDHIAAPAIIALSQSRATFIDRLKEVMSAWDTPPAYAAIFGSAARGQQHDDSDVDLFFARPSAVDDQWDDLPHQLAEQASRWVGADVRPLIFDVSELRGAAAQEPVIRSIVEEGTPVFGDAIEFRKLVKAR